MAAWDNVSLPGAPAAPSYAAPLVNFSPIGNLPDDYFQGTQRKRTLALQGAFKEGLPRNADGSLDITSMADTLAKLGGADAAQPLMQLQIEQQIGAGNANAIPGSGGTQAPGGSASGGPMPAAAPRPSVPAHGIPSSAPPPGVQTSGEATEPDTLANIVQSQISDPNLAGKVMTAAAARLGIDPGAKIDPNNPTVQAYIRSAKGGVVPNGATAGQAPPQAVVNNSNLEAQAQTFEQRANTAFRRAAAIGGFPNQAAAAGALEKYGQAQMEQAKILRDQIAKNSELTPEQKNATASGASSPAEFKRLEEQNKFDVEQFGKQYQGITAAAASAESMLPHIQLAQGLLNNPMFYSGTGNDIVLGYRKMLAAIDPAHANDALPQEAFRKVMAANILEQVNSLKAEGAAAGMTTTRIFQSQIALMEKAAQNPANTIAANRLLTEIGQRSAQRSMMIAKMADNYNGGHLDPGFNKQLRAYLSSHPMFTPDEMQDPRRIAPPTFATPAQVSAAKLGPNVPFKTPDGRIKYTPAGP